jgi:flavin reductase (DIM6/NTAB) family NADH-FMN oxidoreductase RutF
MNSLKTKKVEVNPEIAHRLLHPRHTVLVSSVDKTGKANIITFAWAMPMSINPPMLVISITPKRYLHRIIEETDEFMVNIPAMKLAALHSCWYCNLFNHPLLKKFQVLGNGCL